MESAKAAKITFTGCLAVLAVGFAGCPRAGPPAVQDSGVPQPPRATAPCSGPGYRHGPPVAAQDGGVPFEVFENCLWPGNARLAIGARLTAPKPPSRAQVEQTLRDLWAQASRSLGNDFPRTAQVCLFKDPAWSPDFVGCLSRGFEPPAEEDEDADGGEEQPDLENRAAYSPEEEGRRIEGLLTHAAQPGTKAEVRVDPGRAELAVTYRLPSNDCTEAAADFFSSAWTFYPTTTELHAFRFVALGRGKPLLEIRLPDEAAFLSMDPWPMRERLAQNGLSLEATRSWNDIASGIARKEMAAALARLPRAAVTANRALCAGLVPR